MDPCASIRVTCQTNLVNNHGPLFTTQEEQALDHASLNLFIVIA